MVRGLEGEAWKAGSADDVAHAARGPFAAALPALDMLLDGLLGETTDVQREALQTVDRAISRAFADSRDLVTLLVARLDGFEPHPRPCPIDGLLADAAEAAVPDRPGAVRVTLVPSLRPAYVDRAATVAALAVLVRRSASPGQDIGLEEGTAPYVEVRAEQSDERADEVCVRLARAGADTDEERDPGAVAPEAAPLLVVRKLLEKQGGRLSFTGGTATVWLPAGTGPG